MCRDLKTNFACVSKTPLQNNLLFKKKNPLVCRTTSSGSYSVLQLSIQLFAHSHLFVEHLIFPSVFSLSFFYSQGQKGGRYLQFLHKPIFFH